MPKRSNLLHSSLLAVVSGIFLIVLENIRFALALGKIGGIYTFALLPIAAVELGLVWLTLKYSKSWRNMPVGKRNIFYVLVIVISLSLVVAMNFTNSFGVDVLSSLVLSFLGIYFMLLGLLKYRDYLLSLS